MMLTFALAIAIAGAAPQPPGPACTFTLTQSGPKPVITGPADLVRASRVIDQPDSPLRIVRVDLSAVMFGRTGEGLVSLDVLNASDRPIRGGAVNFTWRAGHDLTPSVLTFKSALAPLTTLRLDARLADDLIVDMTSAAVMASVGSVGFEGCTYDPAQPASTGVFTPGFGFIVRPAAEACLFTAAADVEAATLAGSPDVVRRVSVAVQPGSPLRIRRVDVSRLRVNIGDGWVQMRGAFSIEVQNVSDREIEGADVRLLTGPGRPAEGHGTMWKGTLQPGKRLVLRADKVATIVDLQPGAANPTLYAVVERVSFGTCLYQPAKGFPTARH